MFLGDLDASRLVQPQARGLREALATELLLALLDSQGRARGKMGATESEPPPHH